MSHLGQRRGEFLQAFRHPDRGPHRIAKRRRLHKALKCGNEPRIGVAPPRSEATAVQGQRFAGLEAWGPQKDAMLEPLGEQAEPCPVPEHDLDEVG
jgi:hypothetical protein